MKSLVRDSHTLMQMLEESDLADDGWDQCLPAERTGEMLAQFRRMQELVCYLLGKNEELRTQLGAAGHDDSPSSSNLKR